MTASKPMGKSFGSMLCRDSQQVERHKCVRHLVFQMRRCSWSFELCIWEHMRTGKQLSRNIDSIPLGRII
jgi:hypothetical protein